MLTFPRQEVTPQRFDSKRHLSLQEGAVNESQKHVKGRLMRGGHTTEETGEEMLEGAGHYNNYTGIVKICATFA